MQYTVVQKPASFFVVLAGFVLISDTVRLPTSGRVVMCTLRCNSGTIKIVFIKPIFGVAEPESGGAGLQMRLWLLKIDLFYSQTQCRSRPKKGLAQLRSMELDKNGLCLKQRSNCCHLSIDIVYRS